MWESCHNIKNNNNKHIPHPHPHYIPHKKVRCFQQNAYISFLKKTINS